MGLSFFIGRFHLVLVHLAIGLLLLAAMMQFFSGKKRFEKLDSAIAFSLLMGTASAGLAAILAGFCWLLKTKKIEAGNRVLTFSITALVLMIFYTGHLGGNLTHGKDYLLQYAPVILKTVFGSKSGVKTKNQQFSNPDSTFVFNNLILPFLKGKCGDCHDEKDKKDGEALSYDQIRLLEWWINEGVSFEKAVSEYDLPKDIEMLLEKIYGLEITTKSFVETLIVPPVSDAVFQKLNAQNFKVTRLAANNN